MGKAPAFPLYAADFYMDTLGWPNEEVGIYVRLLFSSWVNGPLPNDIQSLSRIAQCGAKKFSVNWKKLQTKFILDREGKYINLRLEETRVKQAKYRDSLSIAGKKGALKRWYKDGDPIDDPIDDPNSQNIPLQSSVFSFQSSEEQPAHPSRHFKDKLSEKYVGQIVEYCGTLDRFSKLSQNGLKLNGWQWTQKMTNEGLHPLAMIDGLKATIKKWHDPPPDDLRRPFAHAETIAKRMSGNYRESEFIEQSQKFKEIWTELLRSPETPLKKIIKGIGKEVE